jgi:hypothetical protein
MRKRVDFQMQDGEVVVHQRKRRMRGDPRACPRSCPGGNLCCLNDAFDHTLHVCMDDGCYCHTEKRYKEIRA